MKTPRLETPANHVQLVCPEAKNPGMLAPDAHVWAYLGASLGAEYRAGCSSVADKEPMTVGVSIYSEVRNIAEHGSRYISLLGSRLHFYRSNDMFKKAVDTETPLCYTNIFLSICTKASEWSR